MGPDHLLSFGFEPGGLSGDMGVHLRCGEISVQRRLITSHTFREPWAGDEGFPGTKTVPGGAECGQCRESGQGGGLVPRSRGRASRWMEKEQPQMMETGQGSKGWDSRG